MDSSTRPALQAIDRFRKKPSTQQNREKLLNYGERSTGLRNPDAPCGFINQDSGVTAMYAGRARIFVALGGMIAAVADTVGIAGNSIYLNPRDIRNLKFLGKSINLDVFTGDKKTITVTKEGMAKLSTMFVVTRNSRATDAGITDIHPLSEVFSAVELFESGYQCPEIAVEKFKSLSSALGVSLSIGGL